MKMNIRIRTNRKRFGQHQGNDDTEENNDHNAIYVGNHDDDDDGDDEEDGDDDDEDKGVWTNRGKRGASRSNCPKSAIQELGQRYQ